MREKILDFFSYFFGKGENEFKYFGISHIIPILILGGIIYLLFRYKEILKTYKNEEKLRISISLIMILAEMSYFWRLLHTDIDSNVYEHLPITICGIANVICAYMLITKNKKCFDVVYFLVLGASINAIITPAVLTSAGPTRFRYYQYWVEHMMLFISVFYMITIFDYRPTWKSYIPSIIVLCIIGGIAIFTNWLLGSGYTLQGNFVTANYLFINTVEDGFSIANYLPANLFLKWMCIIMIVSILYIIPYIPWIFIDRKTKLKTI